VLALYIVAGIFLLAVVALSVPIDVTFDLTTREGGRQGLRVGVLFGLFGRTLIPRKARRRARKARKPGPPKRARGRRQGIGLLLAIVRTRGLMAQALRTGRRMLASVHIRRLNAGLRLGFADPADTGLLYAAIWPAMLTGASSRRFRLDIAPVFTGPTFEADLSGDVRVFPVQLVSNALRFAFSLAGLRTMKALVVQWWKRRR
jgi:hypothetical protein